MLFSLDDDDKYSVDDGFSSRMGSYYQDKSVVDQSNHSDSRRDVVKEEVNTNIVVRSVSLSVPAFNFELSKSISASEYQEAQFEDGNIEAIYGILSVKLFGIGLSIPMDDASLCQFLAMFFANSVPIYPYVSAASAITDKDVHSISERGLRRGT